MLTRAREIIIDAGVQHSSTKARLVLDDLDALVRKLERHERKHRILQSE